MESPTHHGSVPPTLSFSSIPVPHRQTTLRKRLLKLWDHVTPARAAIGFVVLGGVILILGAVLPLSDYWDGTISNLGVECLSIAITVIVIDRLNQKQTDRERRADLITKMRSSDHARAMEAVEQLRAHGWLTNGLLEEADLRSANLQSANLSGANLQEAYLFGTNLQAADLGSADLSGAVLAAANLRAANLWHTNLRGAFLKGAHLQGAFLTGADLEGAQIDTEGEGLHGATLPDHTKWSPDVDMRRFTDPTHPHFWRSEDPECPAFHKNRPT